jgi:hypothetical protein
MYQLRSPWSLCRIAQAIAAGCGVESTVSALTRSGWRWATAQATAPPQSCPTTCALASPAASSRATTSATSSRRWYAARERGQAPGEYPRWSGDSVRSPAS